MIRSLMLALAVGTFVGCVDSAPADTADEQTAATEQHTGGFNCVNKASIVGVECIGSIAVLPINVDIKNVGVLDGNKLSVLNDDLNHLSVLDGNILDNNKILNDVELTVLQDFLNKFLINVSKNDIDVCTSVLGILLCK
ncbi:MAG TPA: hypothetical protein VLM79_25015 [Kofleriaceae bacterium]|nr:hypothetical protein [Kofleriaceae bacterium]